MAGETEKLRPVNSIFIPMLLSLYPIAGAYDRAELWLVERIKTGGNFDCGLSVADCGSETSPIRIPQPGTHNYQTTIKQLAAVRAIPESSSGRGTWRRSGEKASALPSQEF